MTYEKKSMRWQGLGVEMLSPVFPVFVHAPPEGESGRLPVFKTPVYKVNRQLTSLGQRGKGV